MYLLEFQYKFKIIYYISPRTLFLVQCLIFNPTNPHDRKDRVVHVQSFIAENKTNYTSVRNVK